MNNERAASTVKQLIDLLHLCNPDDKIRFFDFVSDHIKTFDIVCVERDSTDGVVYLRKKPIDTNEFTSVHFLRNLGISVEIIKQSENFAETTWEKLK